MRMKDQYRDHCRECVHFAPWPERARYARRALGVVPMGYPLNACMADPCSVEAVNPDDSPANPCSIAAGCVMFERGSRGTYSREN